MAAPQQQQQYEYQSQYQIPPTTTPTILTNDPSSQQLQSYDPSYYNAYYAQPQPQPQPQQPQQQQQPQQPQQQEYTTTSSAYYYQDYSAVYPPGVDPNTQSSYIHSSQHAYYPPAVPSHTPSGYYVPGPSAPRGGSSHGGGVVRGRGGGGRGRGRGRGRGKHGGPTATNAAASQSLTSSSSNNAAPGKPSQMAWCEICRVDCNTADILEQHKNGKKHKKNLKVYEELQNLSKVSVVQPTPENAQGLQPTTTAEAENKGVTAPPTQVPATNEFFSGRGGLKRKMRGGRGGKWMRAYDGSRRLVAPTPVPKQVVPLFCELCNVRCESQVVFDTHIAGKKHLSNVKRFEGHKKALGEGVKELYPTIPNLASILSAATQANQQSAGDAQALASTMLSQQNIQDPQEAQAALVQLLHQHGIYDAPTLVAQLIPYLLAHFQAPVPVAQNFQLQGAQFPSGAEIETEQPNKVENGESKQGGNEVNGKPGDAESSLDNAVVKPSEDADGGSEPIVTAPTEEAVVEVDKN